VQILSKTLKVLAKLVLCVGFGGALVAAAVILLAGPVRGLVTGSTHGVAIDETNLGELSQNSTVYAADGSVLAVLHADENRVSVPLSAVPPTLVNAILDTEDAHYWIHGSVDLRGSLRALSADIKSGGVAEGGSTITQQLVKNAFPSPERNLDRKIQEAAIAMRLARTMTKQQILERYLNTIYFGNGAYGVQAAAETYFNVPVGQLNVAQDALLAGIIQDPELYDPTLHPKAAVDRRAIVVANMVKYGHLTQPVANFINKLPVPGTIYAPNTPKQSYFVTEVEQRLLGDTTLGASYDERYNALFRGGLKIYTTLDPHLQSVAENRVATMIPATSVGYTGALVAVDSKTGKVKALVGGPGFDKFKFDIATQALRSPGSSFKIFTLLAFLEAGYGPNDVVDGAGPCMVKFPDYPPNYSPINNFEGEAYGDINVVQATANSVNCAFERMAATVGLPQVVAMARRLGITSPLPLYPTTVIGSAEVRPIEMAGAYATLADDGIYHRPTLVDRVLDRNGKVIEIGGDPGHRVLSPQISREAVQILENVIKWGTGANAALPHQIAAGKTGTASNYGNAWFDGFTPQMTTVVWMGSPAGNIPIIVDGVRVVGGNYPAKVWGSFMTAALADQPPVDFPVPDPYEIPGYQYIYGTLNNIPTYSIYPPYGGGVPTTSPATTTTVPTGPTTSSPPTTSPPPTSPPTTSPPTTSPPTTSPPTTKPPHK
jgi:penicillin-binding protein 1A